MAACFRGYKRGVVAGNRAGEFLLWGIATGMARHRILVAVAVLVLACGGAFAGEKPDTGPATISAEVRAMYRDAIVIDTHDDTPSRISIEGIDIGKRLPDGNVDIPRLLDGGVTGIFFSIWPDPVFVPHDSIRRRKWTMERRRRMGRARR